MAACLLGPLFPPRRRLFPADALAAHPQQNDGQNQRQGDEQPKKFFHLPPGTLGCVLHHMPLHGGDGPQRRLANCLALIGHSDGADVVRCFQRCAQRVRPAGQRVGQLQLALVVIRRETTTESTFAFLTFTWATGTS